MKNLIIIPIRAYQWLISPFLRALCGPGCGCRFEPSCSQYFVEAVHSHGARKGSLMGLRRLARCHPWGSYGFDPVPQSTSPIPKHN